MSVQNAMKLSARIIVRLRSHLSTYTPTNGPSSDWGNMPAIAANASTSAEPVSMLIQKMIA